MIHGFNSSPNSSWMPWLLGELKSRDIYACSLYMPEPDTPIVTRWVHEISRVINDCTKNSEIYLIGHSLGVAAILNYLQSSEYITGSVQGGVLVSGRAQPSDNNLTRNFYENFDFEILKDRIKNFCIIHGTNDSYVPVENAYILGDELNIKPIIIDGGTHFTRGEGYAEFPTVLDELLRVMNEK